MQTKESRRSGSFSTGCRRSPWFTYPRIIAVSSVGPRQGGAGCRPVQDVTDVPVSVEAVGVPRRGIGLPAGIQPLRALERRQRAPGARPPLPVVRAGVEAGLLQP